jgi:hypothetical protein
MLLAVTLAIEIWRYRNSSANLASMIIVVPYAMLNHQSNATGLTD